MSADNWRKCPKCSKPQGFFKEETKKKYGKVSAESYLDLLENAESCRACRFSFEFKERKEIKVWLLYSAQLQVLSGSVI